MNNQLTDLTLILDRSGSMATVREALEESLGSLLRKQAQEPGKLVVSLVRFDDVVESVFVAIDAQSVRPIRIRPRNSTALLDAIGLTIDATGKRLAALAQSDRPGCVIVVVITDGMENASRKFNWVDVQQSIRHQTDQYQWQFIFLGANIDAIATATQLGISAGDALDVASDNQGTVDAVESLSKGVKRKRDHLLFCASGTAPASFDTSDRDQQRREK